MTLEMENLKSLTSFVSDSGSLESVEFSGVDDVVFSAACSGTFGTLGSAGTLCGCFGCAGTYGSYGCGA